MNRLGDVFRKAQLGGPWAGKEETVGEAGRHLIRGEQPGAPPG